MHSVGEMIDQTTSMNPDIRVESATTHSMERDWVQSLADAVRSPLELARLLELPAEKQVRLVETPDFPVLVPHSYLQRMEPLNPDDPLLRQVLPLDDELVEQDGFVADPVGDLAATASPGLLHKYHGRVLMIATGACAVHCRYCFRRHFPYSDAPKQLTDWQPAIDVIAADETIQEVILSGGDPLVLTDRRLDDLLQLLEGISHLKRVRIHSRLPIVLPNRVTQSLIDRLKASRLQPVMVVHANHGNELVDDCAESLSQLVTSGIPTLNQAVLLKGVNDSVDALADLCERCVNLGVMPYYLHQLDRVSGAAHFEVPVATGRTLIEQLRHRLPGYAVPKYVTEQPGDESKLPL